MKEALYYNKLDQNRVECVLCPHNCILKLHQTGICLTRQNIEGKLISNSYNNICSVHSDPIEKKPFYHVMPASKTLSIATGGCNLKCRNCQNYSIARSRPEQIGHYHLSPKEIIALAKKYDCDSIAYTYTDPVVYYELCLDTAMEAKKHGLKNLYISAGYINTEPLQELAPYLDAANIDLKSFDEKIYKKLNKADLQTVLNTLVVLNKQNVFIEITNLVIPGWTDNLNSIRKMCLWLKYNGLKRFPIHFSRFVPMHELIDAKVTPEETLIHCAEIAKDIGMKHVYLGNLYHDKWENTYCSYCGEELIIRNGFRVEMNIIEKNCCPKCNTLVDGIW